MLHATVILAMSASGKTMRVYMGGYNSVTTRSRLNTYLPGDWGIYTEQGQPWLTNRKLGIQHALDAFTPATFSVATGKLIKGKLADLDRVARLKKLLRDYCFECSLGNFTGPDGDPFLPAGNDIGEATAIEWIETGYRPVWIAVTAGLANAPYWASKMRDDATARKRLDKYQVGMIRNYLKKQLGL